MKYAQRYYDRQFFTRKNVNQDILGRFEKLLQNTFDANETLESGIPTVKELGEKMGMSSHYLSELLKKRNWSKRKISPSIPYNCKGKKFIVEYKQ